MNILKRLTIYYYFFATFVINEYRGIFYYYFGESAADRYH